MNVPRVFPASPTLAVLGVEPTCEACGWALGGRRNFGRFHVACLDRLMGRPAR